MFRTMLALAIGCSLILAAPGAAAANQASPSQAPPAKGAPTTLLDLNTATLAQLEALPGVGAKLAERILQYRQKNGRFGKIEELMNVQGIGEKNFLRLKPLVTVAPPQKDERTGVSV